MQKEIEKPGGSTPSQYGLPAGATDLQDLIEYRGMNFALGNVFKACYRRGTCSHSDELRDMRKVLWFAEREVKRLEREKLAEEVKRDLEQRAENLRKWYESNPDETVPNTLRNNTDGVHPASSLDSTVYGDKVKRMHDRLFADLEEAPFTDDIYGVDGPVFGGGS